MSLKGQKLKSSVRNLRMLNRLRFQQRKVGLCYGSYESVELGSVECSKNSQRRAQVDTIRPYDSNRLAHVARVQPAGQKHRARAATDKLRADIPIMHPTRPA